MARPTKEGIDYFPMDVDFFEDDKLQLIGAEFGEKGLIVAMKLMCKIYKENGYYYQWGDDQCLLFSKNAGVGFVPSLVNEIVNGLVRRSFFDKGVFDSFKVLTSKGFQKRYFEATKKRKDVTVFTEMVVIDNINSINSNINSINYVKSTQSKVKESKVKESINEAVASNHAPEILEAFSKFENWIDDKYPNVRKIKKQISIENYLKLKQQLGDMRIVLEKLEFLHNSPKYFSGKDKKEDVYLTIKNWIRRDGN